MCVMKYISYIYRGFWWPVCFTMALWFKAKNNNNFGNTYFRWYIQSKTAVLKVRCTGTIKK